jgi:hypothetical protein
MNSKDWWNSLAEAERISVERVVLLLEDRGPQLPFPYSSGVIGSRHSAMHRTALLLLGGNKTGDERWYEKNVPLADQLYDKYLAEIEEGNNAKDNKV